MGISQKSAILCEWRAAADMEKGKKKIGTNSVVWPALSKVEKVLVIAGQGRRAPASQKKSSWRITYRYWPSEAFFQMMIVPSCVLYSADQLLIPRPP